jgi:hypothetical protein
VLQTQLLPNHNVLVINNTMLNSTHVSIVELDNSQETISSIRMVYAKPTMQTVLNLVEFNLDRPNASNAKLAQVIKYSMPSKTLALPQLLSLSDHNVIATKSSTKPLTPVSIAE